jgi:MoaA/NifB/PqqE/SkfB family radical SAM enzyme
MALDPRLGAAMALAQGVFGWHVGRGTRMVSATFAVTNRCNLRCNYCNTPFLDPQDLPLPSVELVFDRLRELGVKRLGLTGGEPLARKDIREVVTLAKARGFWVTMNTNLTLYARRKAELAGVDMFFTSLDGPRAEHEAARGEGSFDGVLEAAREITQGGRRVVAICVVSEHNLAQARELLDVASSTGIQLHFQPQCYDTAIVRGSPASELTNARLRSFFARLLDYKRDGLPIASSGAYLEALSQWNDFSRTASLDAGSRCLASRGFMYVDPHGDAYPCAYTKGKSTPVSMLGPDWRTAVDRELPCTRCSVGPYLEFNLLYQRPVRSALNVLRSYA